MQSRHLLYSVLFALLFSHAALTQPLYRWQDESGKTHYSDQAPADFSYHSLALLPERPLYEVEKVLDGDTIIVKGGGKVRLLGINTPEIAHRQRAAEPLGDKAHQRLQQLLEGRRVYLEFDQQRRDRFKRLLAHVTLEDGSNLNEQLLREGLARALFLQPNMQHLQDYFRIEAEAQQAKRGIWSLAAYRLRPATQAGECLKQFCRLHGLVKKVTTKHRYTYLSLPGRLQLALHHDQLQQFKKAGVDISQLQGKEINVRGWVGTRNATPYLRLEHPYQIEEIGTAWPQ